MTLAHPTTTEPTGLEDFETGDMVMPQLRIDHQEGTLVDSLSGEASNDPEVILLGLVKQRILWEADMSTEKLGPLCRSLTFVTGLPDMKRFPWAAAGFDAEAPALPCEGCQLKEWDSHPKNGTPWCSEQWVFPLLQKTGESWSPSTLTVQRANLKPARAYVTSFARSKSPLYVATTKLVCQQQRRGTVKYVTLSFIKGAPTPEELHPDFADQYRRIREFVQTPRSNEEEITEPANAAAPTASRKSAAAVEDDEDIDF